MSNRRRAKTPSGRRRGAAAEPEVSALAANAGGVSRQKSWSTKTSELANKASAFMFGPSGVAAEPAGYESKAKYMRSRWDQPEKVKDNPAVPISFVAQWPL